MSEDRSTEKRTFQIWMICVLLASVGSWILLWDPGVPTPEDPETFHLFLLAGQSNMVGRARAKDEDGTEREPNPKVLTLDAGGKWRVAEDPIHFDDGAGIGPGTSFGDALVAANPGITVGLIPVAVGGTSISAWEPGVEFGDDGIRVFDDAIRRLRMALPRGRIKAVLWHQGETDAANSDLARAFGERFGQLVLRLRQEAGDAELPFLIGELGRYLDPVEAAPDGLVKVRRAHEEKARMDDRVVLVSSEGLEDKGDRLHFDATSQRELGRRFAEKFLKMAGVDREPALSESR